MLPISNARTDCGGSDDDDDLLGARTLERFNDEDNDHDLVSDLRADDAETSGRNQNHKERLTDWLSVFSFSSTSCSLLDEAELRNVRSRRDVYFGSIP